MQFAGRNGTMPIMDTTQVQLKVKLYGSYHDGYEGVLKIRGSVPIIAMQGPPGSRYVYLYKLEGISCEGVYHYVFDRTQPNIECV